MIKIQGGSLTPSTLNHNFINSKAIFVHTFISMHSHQYVHIKHVNILLSTSSVHQNYFINDIKN